MTTLVARRQRVPLYVEPFAGAAAVALQLIGGPRCHPPVSWMGGKRRLAPAILAQLGLRPWQGAARVVLNDVGPWGWVWPALLDPARAAAVARGFRNWADEPIQALWFRLRDEGPRVNPAEAVAQWLVLQARSASGAPVFWADSEGRMLHPTPRADGTWEWGVAELRQGSGGGRRPQSAGQTRSPTPLQGDRRPSHYYPAWQNKTPTLVASNGRVVIHAAGVKGDKTYEGRVGGLVRIETLACRVEALALALGGKPIEVIAGRAEDLPGRLPRDLTGAAIYLDPPYRGCTGYGWDVERAALLAMADDYARRGARVVISESSSLVGELGAGWSAVDVTIGRKAEWLTRWGCAPVRRVHSQLRLFSCTETTT